MLEACQDDGDARLRWSKHIQRVQCFDCDVFMLQRDTGHREHAGGQQVPHVACALRMTLDVHTTTACDVQLWHAMYKRDM
jgi:hypothetical protein